MIGRLHEFFEIALYRVKADALVLGFRSHPFRRSSSEKPIKASRYLSSWSGEKQWSPAESCSAVTIGRILFPVDFSETSAKSLKTAKKLSVLFSSELHIIHIVANHIVKRSR
ncbi:MAG TPA: hypothetical protein DCP92_12840 [Nitrospiraceae bacterium]|nr:hypothetical protein [Nitrospiraceae bacterium]